jgi:predicted GNAT family acetyltransferase
MSELLRTSCVCGWESTGTEDEVVGATLDHGLRVHNMAGTREQVLERAERLDASPNAELPLTIVDVPERRRFEARLGSRVIGFSRYNENHEQIALVHTEIEPDMEGKGYGSVLARAVLDDVRSRGVPVVVRCPFIAAYVRRHRADYPDVEVAPEVAKSGVS